MQINQYADGECIVSKLASKWHKINKSTLSRVNSAIYVWTFINGVPNRDARE